MEKIKIMVIHEGAKWKLEYLGGKVIDTFSTREKAIAFGSRLIQQVKGEFVFKD